MKQLTNLKQIHFDSYWDPRSLGIQFVGPGILHLEDEAAFQEQNNKPQTQLKNKMKIKGKNKGICTILE